MKRTLIATALLTASAGLAAAHDTTPIERELRQQGHMIEDGRRDGDLTWREVRQLRAEQSRIGDMLRTARYDGKVTKREFDAICDAQEAAKSNISDELADGQTSRWRRWSSRRDGDDGRGWGNSWRRYGYGWGTGYGRGRGTY